MTIWESCQGERHIKPFEANPWRVVEAQHVLSSRDLVDNNHEHDILESLLEQSKPPVIQEKGYLIFTPFRYPPLKYGSRFGDVFEPSLWYGSLTLDTAFAETAYYRRKFLNDTEANLGYVELTLTAFKAFISTERGIELTKSPFKAHQDKISSPSTYDYSQAIGRAMRQSDVSAFSFVSARVDDGGVNIAAFTPDVFCARNNQYIHEIQNWQCIANKEVVEFTRSGFIGHQKLIYSSETSLSYADYL